MAIINYALREIGAKVVFFGEDHSIVDEAVRQLHELVEDATRSDVHILGPTETPSASVLFQFTPAREPLGGFTTRVTVYSLGADALHPAHRGEVLRGADALVFLADARPDRNNLQALFTLEEFLSEVRQELATLPTAIHVCQAADPSLDPEQIVYDLNPYGFPVVTVPGPDGLREALRIALTAVVERIRRQLAGERGSKPLSSVHRASRLSVADVTEQHQQRIDQAGPTPPLAGLDRAAPPMLVELPWPQDEYRPVRLLQSDLEGDRLHLDLLASQDGTSPIRVRLVLRPPTDSTSSTSSGEVLPVPAPPSATSGLPDRIELPPRTTSADLPPIYIGLAGLTGGFLAGGLLGYLIFG